jgi:hypothetical protein
MNLFTLNGIVKACYDCESMSDRLCLTISKTYYLMIFDL